MNWPVAAAKEDSLILKKRPAAAAAGEKIENTNLVDIVNANDPNFTTNGAINPTYTDDGNTVTFNALPIGESIIAPDAQYYEVTINLAQRVPIHDVTGTAISQDYDDMTFKTVKMVVRAGETPEPFLPGYSYNFKCTVYGLEKIEITATLEPWKQGEEIEVIGE